MNVPGMRKAITPLMDHLDTKRADPLMIAYEIATYPDEEQEGFFEVCLAYIQEVSGRNQFFTPNMANYGEIARRINKAIS